MESTQESMEDDPTPVIPEYFVGDIVAVTEFKKPNIGNKIGVKVLGGIARVIKVDDKTCDLNYYLEGRRVKEVPFEYMRRAPSSFDSTSPSGASGFNGEDAESGSGSLSSSEPQPAGSWEAQALRQAETLARAGSKRERKQIVHFEITKHEPQRRNKQAKQGGNSSSTSAASAANSTTEKSGNGGAAVKGTTVSGSRGNKKSNKNSTDTTSGSSSSTGSVDNDDSDIPELPILPRNAKAFKQGKWRREPFDFRE